MNTFFSFNALNSLRAAALTGSLLTAGCVADTEPDPVEPVGPAPLNTILSEDLAAHTDGCLYGTASYSLAREDTEGNLIVAMQTSCPANYFIEGSCHPRLSHSDGSFDPKNVGPLLDSVCFNPQLSVDRGIEACQLGALLCAVSSPGDRTETTTDNSGESPTTTTETIPGPDLIDLQIYLRCCPSM